MFFRKIFSLGASFFLLAIGTSIGDYVRADELKVLIREFKQTYGRAITEDECVAILTSSENRVPVREMRQYAELMKQQQNPHISKAQLVSLSKARVNSIKTIEAKWTYSVEYFRNPAANDDVTRFFTLVDDMALLKTIPNRGVSTQQNLVRIASYDGESLRLVDTPVVDSSGDALNAFISRLESYENYFFFTDNILWVTMLLNPPYMTSNSLSASILGLLNDDATIVFETMVEFNGSKCVVLSNGVFRAYLDPNSEYSVVGLETYAAKNIRRNGVWCFDGLTLRSRRTLFNLRDYGNSLYFPDKIVSVIYNRDKESDVDIRETVNVLSLEVNKVAYERQYFSDVIPDDAMVADGINNLVYRQSDSASINALLKEVAKSKRVWIFQIVSMTLGIILIIIWIIIQYRAYLQRKNANE